MKNFPMIAGVGMLIAAAVTWGVPAVTLSGSGVERYLEELDRQFLAGDAEGYCARLHDDLVVDVTDASSDVGTVRIEGDKARWCGHVASAAKGVELLGLETEATRRNLRVERRWSSPWTAEVTYEEVRVSRMVRIGELSKTRSRDRWTLVQTLSGVKARRLEGDVARAD